MEENKEKIINKEELKKEAANTVNQVRKSMKNVNIKEETIATKGFVGEMFKNPLEKINEIAKDSANKFFKTSIVIMIIWIIVAFIKSVSLWSEYKETMANIMYIIQSTLAPICEIVVLSLIVFILNKKSKKSLITVITTIVTVYVPYVVARVISLLTLLSSSAYRITSPISSLAYIITVILSYFAMKDLFDEKENSTFIKQFVKIEAIYIAIAFILSFLGISIY